MATKSMDLGQVMGTSAYQAAVKAGYTGTEADFNAALFNATNHATEETYGITKLSSSVTSTSKTTAATPYSVKTALDKAKQYCDDAIIAAINSSY